MSLSVYLFFASLHPKVNSKFPVLKIMTGNVDRVKKYFLNRKKKEREM